MDFECQPKSYLELFLILDKKNVPAQTSKRSLKMDSSTGDNPDRKSSALFQRHNQRIRRAMSPGLCACPREAQGIVRAGQAGCMGSRQVRCWPHPPSQPGLLQKGIRAFCQASREANTSLNALESGTGRASPRNTTGSITLCLVLLLNSACAFLRYYTPRPGCVCTARAQGLVLSFLTGQHGIISMSAALSIIN